MNNCCYSCGTLNQGYPFAKSQGPQTCEVSFVMARMHSIAFLNILPSCCVLGSGRVDTISQASLCGDMRVVRLLYKDVCTGSSKPRGGGPQFAAIGFKNPLSSYAAQSTTQAIAVHTLTSKRFDICTRYLGCIEEDVAHGSYIRVRWVQTYVHITESDILVACLHRSHCVSQQLLHRSISRVKVPCHSTCMGIAR